VKREAVSSQRRPLEQFSNSRTLTNSVQGGFYFHPSDEDLSLETPDRKKPLSCCGFGVLQLENRYSRAAVFFHSRLFDLPAAALAMESSS
jgi:hypothetical protein